MVNYVNTVLVGNGSDAILSAAPTSYATANVGKYLIMDVSDGKYLTAATIADAEAIKIGIVTSQSTFSKNGKLHVIKWSNVIKRHNLKSYHSGAYTADTEDKVVLDFTSATMTELSKGNMRVLVRLTFKDTPTRYRKWTDTYEYVTAAGDDATKIAQGLADVIAKEYKRSRVTATAASGKLTIEALPYDDDDAVDTINWAAKVRFSANAYYTNPQAAGFASKNKYTINGLKIDRTPGVAYTAAAKLVRDREAWGMGYQGILNRGDGTWPIIKPAMATDLTKNYDYAILEFETMYRAADDIQRHTKECLEVYEVTGGSFAIKAAIEAWLAGNSVIDTYATIDAEDIA